MENLISGGLHIRRENTSHPHDVSFTSGMHPPSEKKKWHLLIPTLYLVSSFFLFSLLYTLFDVYIAHLKVETGVVSAPLQTMVAPTATNNSKPILLLKPTPVMKQVVAYLTQDEVAHISIRSTVKIYLPSLGKTFNGKVVAINRTAGFMDEVKAQYRWRDFQIDRSATATIAVDPQQNKFAVDAASGMPAVVYFPRKYTIL